MSIKPKKVVIIGAGHVGSHVGYTLASQGICDEIVFIDTDQKKAIAQVKDIEDSIVYMPYHTNIKLGDYSDIDNAKIIVISAGPLPTTNSGMTRMDTLGMTIDAIKPIVENIKKSKFEGIIVSISNPADVIAHYIQQKTGIPSKRVISTSTTLDTARLKCAISRVLNISTKSICAYVLGEHGESQMVPWSCVSIYGKSLFSLMKEFPETYGKLDLDKIAKEGKLGGWDIFLGKSCTEFGIGISATEIIKTILSDEKKVSMISVLLNGEYGQHNVYASIPAILGKNGVEEIIELPLNEKEIEEFKKSCDTMKENFEIALNM